jgi:hypothetical protein
MENGADAIHDGHQAVTNGSKDAFDLESVSI